MKKKVASNFIRISGNFSRKNRSSIFRCSFRSKKSETKKRIFYSRVFRRNDSLQIVPFIPIHPGQLNEKRRPNEQISRYFVEEPIEPNFHRPQKVKRFEQIFIDEKIRFEKNSFFFSRTFYETFKTNKSFSVIELQNSFDQNLFIKTSNEYFIDEPTTPL